MANKKRYEEFKQALREVSNGEALRRKLGLDSISKVHYLVNKGKQEGIIFSPRRGVYHKRVVNYKPEHGEQSNIETTKSDQ